MGEKKLELRTDSWLYKFTYGWRDQPKKVTTCSFLINFLFSPIAYLGLGIAYTFCSLMACIIVFFAFVVGFFFAWRPAVFARESGPFVDSHRDFTYYKHWPEWRGRRIWPITIIMVIGGLWSVAYFAYLSPIWALVFIGAASCITAIVGSVFYFFAKSDTWEVAKESWRSFRGRYCKEIKVVDPPKNDQAA